MRKLVLSFLLSFAIFFAHAAQAEAAGSCNISLSPTIIDNNGTTTITITNLTRDGKLVHSNDGGGIYTAADYDDYYVNYPNRQGRLYIPGSTINAGSVVIPGFAEGISYGSNNIEIYHDCGIACNHGQAVCTAVLTVARPDAQQNFNCTWEKTAAGAYDLCIHANTDAALMNARAELSCPDPTDCTDKIPLDFSTTVFGNDKNGQRHTCIYTDIGQFGNFARAAESLQATISVNGREMCKVTINPEDRIESEKEAELEKVRLQAFDYCRQAPAGPQRDACEQCVGNVDAPTGGEAPSQSRIWTAVGCVRVSGSGLTEDIVGLLMGISGGVALLTILGGAFVFSTSQGDAGKVKQGKEMITAAVMGLLFIIFSVIILDFVGVKLLRIPGLN